MAPVFNQVKITRIRAGLVQQQYEAHTKVRVAIDALDSEYNHDARTQFPRLSAARLHIDVSRRGLGHREQEEQRTQRASFVVTYRTRVHTDQQLIVLGSDACLGTSLRGQIRVSERKLACLSSGSRKEHSTRRRT